MFKLHACRASLPLLRVHMLLSSGCTHDRKLLLVAPDSGSMEETISSAGSDNSIAATTTTTTAMGQCVQVRGCGQSGGSEAGSVESKSTVENKHNNMAAEKAAATRRRRGVNIPIANCNAYHSWPRSEALHFGPAKKMRYQNRENSYWPQGGKARKKGARAKKAPTQRSRRRAPGIHARSSGIMVVIRMELHGYCAAWLSKRQR